MSTKYRLNKYVIRYDYEAKTFYMWDKDDVLVGEGVSGRELGRDAWNSGAHEVCYDYDLNLDKNIPLMSYYEKYKAGN